MTAAKPFVKWAGGKTQLLKSYQKYFPAELYRGKIKRYIEPFVGSGALMFEIIQNYKIEEAFIWDINADLITAYNVIKNDVESLIDYLTEKERLYLSLSTEKRKELYYEIRTAFNRQKDPFNGQEVERAGQFIFLNKTCYNGLYRVNRSGLFNVPMGSYKRPKICQAENLRAVHRVLQDVSINLGDYTQCQDFILPGKTFVYFDPPYRPLNATSNFTAYGSHGFTDDDQVALANFFKKLDQMNAYLMLSNSDPQNTNEDDRFFAELYQDYCIYKEKARRTINSKADRRGTIWELVITNYCNRVSGTF